MKKTVEVEISGRQYILATDEEEAYMDQLAAAVSAKMLEIKNASGASELDSAIMAALGFADDLYKEAARRKKAAAKDTKDSKK